MERDYDQLEQDFIAELGPRCRSGECHNFPFRHRRLLQSSPLTVTLSGQEKSVTVSKCHCNQIVTVTRGSLITNQSFGTCQKCHCKRGVTVNSVTVTGEICISKLVNSNVG